MQPICPHVALSNAALGPPANVLQLRPGVRKLCDSPDPVTIATLPVKRYDGTGSPVRAEPFIWAISVEVVVVLEDFFVVPVVFSGVGVEGLAVLVDAGCGAVLLRLSDFLEEEERNS